MIPLGDDSRRTSQVPAATLSIIAANAVVFSLELGGGDRFVSRWALIPADIVAGHHWANVLTSMFMHGGWLHVLGNMLFLWVFGPAIEQAMGRWRYLAFYVLGGAVASLAQVAVSPASTVPSLGASGAIAAVMGAFLVTYPRDQIRTVLLLGVFSRVTRIRAIVLIGVWFLIQAISAQGTLATSEAAQGGVAYVAHVGGFIFGAVAGRLFEDRRRLAEQEPWDTE